MEQQVTAGMAGGGPERGFTCPDCEGHSFTTVLHNDVFEYGSGDSQATLHARVPVHCCDSCDFEFLGREGRLIKHEAVCRHLGLLTPTEIRSIRESHGMSRTEFAEVTGFGEATLNRWENGSVIQNRANDRFLRLLKSLDILDRLKGMVGRPEGEEPPSPPHPPEPDDRGPWREAKVTPTMRMQQAAFGLPVN